MKLGVYTAILHDKPLREALEVIASLGLDRSRDQRGWLPANAAPAGRPTLLAGDVAPQRVPVDLRRHAGCRSPGLNCNGNPLHPDPEVGPEDADDLRNAIRVAGLLGVDRVVTMSGLSAGPPGRPVAGLAREHLGLRLSRLPGLPVGRGRGPVLVTRSTHWPETTASRSLSRCTRRTWCSTRPRSQPPGPARSAPPNVGAEMDPSHLFWQGIDPVSAIEWLGPLVYHAAAKDTRINDNCKICPVLDERFTRIPVEPEPHRPGRAARRQQVARGLGLGLRRRGTGPRCRVLDPIPGRPGERSTRTWPSTSSTRTSSWVNSRVCRSPPKPSKPRTRFMFFNLILAFLMITPQNFVVATQDRSPSGGSALSLPC